MGLVFAVGEDGSGGMGVTRSDDVHTLHVRNESRSAPLSVLLKDGARKRRRRMMMTTDQTPATMIMDWSAMELAHVGLVVHDVMVAV